MSLTRKVAHNTIIQLVGRGISTILALVVVAMVTRYLSPQGYGQYTTAMVFLQFFGILADMGLYMVLVREIATGDDAHHERVVNNIFTLRLVSAIVFLGIAPAVALLFPYPLVVRIGIAVASISFLCITLNQVLLGLYQKHLRIAWFTIAEVIGRFFLLGATALFMWQGRNLLWIFGAVSLGGAVNFVITFIAAQRFSRIRLSFDMMEWKRLLILTAPLALSVMLNLMYFKADTIVLSWFGSEADVGLYGAPYKILEVIITFPAMFAGLVFPVITAAYAAGDMEKFQRVFQKAFDALLIVALPLIAGAWVVGTPLMRFIAGDAYATSGDILKVLIIATAIIFVGNLFGNTVVSVNKQKAMVWRYGVVAAFALTGYLALIPRYSYWGAAGMTVVAELMITLFAASVVMRASRLRLSFMTAGKIAVASIGMALVLLLLRDVHVVFGMLVGIFVYTVLLFVLRVLSKDVITEVIRMR